MSFVIGMIIRICFLIVVWYIAFVMLKASYIAETGGTYEE